MTKFRISAALALVAVTLLPQPSPGQSQTHPDCGAQIRVVSEGKPIVAVRWSVVGQQDKPVTDGEGIVCVATKAIVGSAVANGSALIEGLLIAEGFVVTRTKIKLPSGTKSSGSKIIKTVELLPAFGEELVVSANRYERRLLDVPVHIQRVGRQSIAASSSRTLADAVEYASGVRVESNCQNCNFSQVRLLGLEGPYSQILVDGQPSLSSLALVYGIEQIPAASLDGVEITKGGGSALYGAGAVGGTINLIPRVVDHTGLHIEATALRTGNEPGRSVMAFGELANENRRHSLTVLVQDDKLDPSDLDEDGFTEVASRELENVNARYQALLMEDRAQLAVDANYTDSNRRGGDLNRFDLPPDQTALTEAIATERTASTARWLQQVSAAFDLRFAGSYSTTKRDSYYGAGFDPAAYGTTDGEVLLGDLQMNRYLDKGTFTFGAQYLQDSTVDSQPAYGRFLDESFDTLSVFAQDDRKISKGFDVALRFSRRRSLRGGRTNRFTASIHALLTALQGQLARISGSGLQTAGNVRRRPAHRARWRWACTGGEKFP